MLLVTLSYSQTTEQRKEIIDSYDLNKLNQLKKQFSLKETIEKQNVAKAAKENDWPIIKKNENGSFDKLQRLRADGSPVYYSISNDDAAKSTRANFLHNGGGLGLNIEGQGMTAHVWDGGPTRPTHEDLTGRLSINDGVTALNANSFHAQHVTGTIAGTGLGNFGSSKGMAPKANVLSHDWDNDLSEATAEAINGMLLSNHSYGAGIANVPDWAFGAYTTQAQDWDDLMYNAPYYLMVAAAGNDGSTNNENGAPLGGNTAYDKLSGNKTAKNNMVVANGYDANINASGTLISVTRNPGSSEGPTDDFRIKPDIMGNGTDLYSAFDNSDSAYSSITGTSMASPNICGSLLLLQQHYSNTNNTFMKAATLKGLALHTADDTETNGPDANTGWGLMNTKAAAETITENGLASWISEETLSQGETFTMTVQSDGTSPLLASISWTDPVTGGYVNTTGTTNTATAALINDLDIRVTQAASTYYPWRLTGVNSNTNANGTDNTVDPFERVDINGASGTYTITVTHKGTLFSGEQNFSLVMTGLSSDFVLTTTAPEQIVCSSSDAIFNFGYEQIGGGTTNITATGLPAGMTSNVTPSAMTSNGSFDVTFGNLASVAAGTYAIDVIGDNGSETETRIVNLRILHPNFNNFPQTIDTPANGTSGMPTTATLTWPENINAESYFIEVSTDPSFGTIFDSSTVTSLNYVASGLSDGTVYYWRVRPDNRCINGNVSTTYSFQTGNSDCSNVYTATDFTNATIAETANVTAYVPITVPATGLIINSMTVSANVDHTYVQDLTVFIQEPAELGSNNVNMLVEPCGDNDNIDATFVDSGAAPACAGDPSISGNIAPESPLVNEIGKVADGTWFFAVTDSYNGDGGVINSASLTICSATPITDLPNFANNGLNVDINSTYTTVTGDIEATTASETAAQQTYTLIELPTMGYLQLNSSTLTVGDTFSQDDVNTGKITFINTEIAAFTDDFLVNISNGASGWLPNQTIMINAAVLNISDFELGELNIYPNPVKSNLFVQLNNTSNNPINISIFDLQGRLVYVNEYNNTNTIFNKTIELNSLANGSYIIQVEHDSKKATKQLIISN